MTRLSSGILLLSILSVTGCARAPYTMANSSHGQGGAAACRKQSACNGSSDAAQQKNSAQSRFEREYENMDEG